MNAGDRSDAGREPLEIELLIPAEKRRVTIEDHLAFRESISGPTQARKESEVARLTAILDEIGKDGEG